MPDYDFLNATDTNLRNINDVNHTADAEVVAVIGTIGSGATAEQVGTVTTLVPGEYSVTTTGTATSFVISFGADYSLVPPP